MGNVGVLARFLFPSRRMEAGWRLTSAAASELFSYTPGLYMGSYSGALSLGAGIAAEQPALRPVEIESGR